jgi:hypothetical protein
MRKPVTEIGFAVVLGIACRRLLRRPNPTPRSRPLIPTTTAPSTSMKQGAPPLLPDHDGTLTKDEYAAAVEKRFNAANRDSDGTLDNRELMSRPGHALRRLVR